MACVAQHCGSKLLVVHALAEQAWYVQNYCRIMRQWSAPFVLAKAPVQPLLAATCQRGVQTV
jgi:hypothetical protein